MESGTDDDENDTTVETGDDVRVHDEELSSNTNEEVGELVRDVVRLLNANWSWKWRK